MRLATFAAGFLLVVASFSTVVLAGFQVPEISAGSLTAGLGLLGGSILMLRARLGRK
jgi:hypothetical protein